MEAPPDPRPDAMAAVDALQQIEDRRISEWRTLHGLTDDSDFEFAFVTWEQACVAAGPLVADRWNALRSAASDSMLQQVSAALEDVEAQIVTPVTTIPQRRARTRRSTRSSSLASTAHPVATAGRVDALAKVWVECGVLKPSGRLSPELQASWAEACRRLASRQVGQAEAVTVANALKTFWELVAVLRSRGRQLPPEEVDVDHFLHHGTTAPRRALAALKWLTKNGELAWPLRHADVPKLISDRACRSQAPVALPPMLCFLEKAIQAKHAIHDPEWTALLGSWMVGMGVLRYQHVMRATPRKVTLSYLHAHCAKGKQRRLRSGFDLAIPGMFTSKWSWLKPWLTAWQALPKASQQCVGLCFHPGESRAWTLKEAQDITQQCFNGQMAGLDNLTSYSWRRLGPTVGQTIKLGDNALAALGDWQGKTAIADNAKMALHDSSAKYAESLKSKATVLGALSVLQPFGDWELVTPDAAQAASDEGRRWCQMLTSQDGHVLWRVPLTPQDMARRFAVSQVMREQAAQRRECAHGSTAVSSMPNQIGGKQLSAFLRDGSVLCGSYQWDRCLQGEQSCGAAHRCAVMCKSGRICGGHHPAMACRDKRALLVKQPVPEPANPPSWKTPLAKPAEARGTKKRKRTREVPAESTAGTTLPISSPSHQEQPASSSPLEGEEKFDFLATVRGRSAMAPTEVFRSTSGGKVFLAGIPTIQTMQHFPPADLQIVCFPESLAEKGGTLLSGALECHVCPNWTQGRTGQWKAVWPLLRCSIYSGNSAVIHCMAGRHRAAVVATMTRSLLAKESIETSAEWIAKRRDIQLGRITGDRGIGAWMHEMVKASDLGSPLPPLVGFIATLKSQLHIRLDGDIPLCRHRQGAARAADRLKFPLVTEDLKEAIAWGRPWCETCISKAPARLQMTIREQ